MTPARKSAAVGDGFDVRSLAVTFSDGYRMADHDHPWGQLIFAVSGVMHVQSDGVIWFVPPTKAIWLPPRKPHEMTMKGSVGMRTLYISGERAAVLPKRALALEVQPVLREMILHVLKIGMLDPSEPTQDRLAAVLIDLIAEAKAADLCLPLPADPRARKLAQWIEAKPGERTDLSTLAGRTGASLRTLQRLFADETGMSLESWRQKARMINGVALLASGESVSNAAIDSGYDSTSAFITAFKKQFGVTPGRYG